MSEWQPIETAPNDESTVILYDGTLVFIGTKADTNSGIETYWDFLGRTLCEPTHWMPLPEPPKQS